MKIEERLMQVLGLIIIVALFILGCIVGKIVMNNVGNTWYAFTGPALGVSAMGGDCWWMIRKKMVGRKDDEKA